MKRPHEVHLSFLTRLTMPGDDLLDFGETTEQQEEIVETNDFVYEMFMSF